MESVLMDPTVTATVIGVLLTGVCGAFAFAVRWLRSDIHDLRTDMNGMRSDMNDLRSEMRSDMNDLRSEMRSDMNDLRSEVNDRFTAVETRITHEVGTLETKVDALGSKLDGLIMALANSGSLTYPPETTPSQSSIGETAGQAIYEV